VVSGGIKLSKPGREGKAGLQIVVISFQCCRLVSCRGLFILRMIACRMLELIYYIFRIEKLTLFHIFSAGTRRGAMLLMMIPWSTPGFLHGAALRSSRAPHKGKLLKNAV